MRQNFSGFCMEEFPQYKAYNNGLGNLTTVELISLGFFSNFGTFMYLSLRRPLSAKEKSMLFHP